MGWKTKATPESRRQPDGEDMFRVDVAGLRRKFANKSKNFLLYELYQNAVDEDVTRVSIELSALENGETCRLVVEDDSPEGFKDLTHSYTLYADSSKLHNPGQRGIWNLGEKLVLAFCTSATISSTRGTVIFSEGRRHHSDEKRERGTRFEGEILMNAQEYELCCKGMESLIPPRKVAVTFNGKRIPVPSAVAEFQCTLPTTIGDETGAIRRTRRKTTIRLYEATERTGGWIYEMGIPVVPCGVRWHCDVQQRVPLNMQRDNVTPAYLQELRVTVLNKSCDLIEVADITSDWARAATSDKRCAPEATVKSMDLRFGKKRVSYDVRDPEANKIAMNEGYTVVSGGSMSKQEWQNAKVAEAIKPAGKVTPTMPVDENPDDPEEELDRSQWTEGMKQVDAYVQRIARALVDHDVEVQIVRKPDWPVAATYREGILTFNSGTLGDEFFSNRSREGFQKINELLIHEFAHEYASDHLTRKFYDSVGLIGARLSQLALDQPECFSEMVNCDHREDDRLFPALSVNC